jgi:hypothetical protein
MEVAIPKDAMVLMVFVLAISKVARAITNAAILKPGPVI